MTDKELKNVQVDDDTFFADFLGAVFLTAFLGPKTF